MDRELARKRPANVMTTLPRQEVITAPFHHRTRLLAEVHRMARRGEIGRQYDVREISNGWAVKVVRIAERPAWWARNGLRASLWAAGTLAVLALAVILLHALVAALAAVMPFLIGVVILLALAGAMAGPSVIKVVQRVDIRR